MLKLLKRKSLKVPKSKKINRWSQTRQRLTTTSHQKIARRWYFARAYKRKVKQARL